MSKLTCRPGWLRLPGSLLFVFVLLIGGIYEAKAQSCDSTTPSFTIDLTGDADSVWTSPSVSRDGHCCGSSGTDRCIVFFVTLDSNAIGVQVDVSGGTGTTYYSVGCGTPILTGTKACITTTGQFHITVCKPGNNPQQYIITSIPRPYSPLVSVNMTPSCSARLIVQGMADTSITWNAITNSTYTANLSCSTQCDTTYVSYSSGFPSYVDYRVCGTSVSGCIVGTRCDTIRVYYYSDVSVSINDDSLAICQGSTTVTATATASGGKPPYTYLWSNGQTTSSITVPAGIYTVAVNDSINCETARDTVVVLNVLNPTPAIGGLTPVCDETSEIYMTPDNWGSTYAWIVTGGTITSGQGTNTITVLWTDLGPQTVEVTETSRWGCVGNDSFPVVVNSLPTTSPITH